MAALFCLLIVPANTAFPQAKFMWGKLEIATQKGVIPLDVEIADTEDKMAQGLMFRRELKSGHGMIFLYDREQEITMWMKNTYISLDMIFIRDDWRVGHIAANTEPLSTDIVSSRVPASRVLEIAAGEAAKLGIRPGDLVTFKR